MGLRKRSKSLRSTVTSLVLVITLLVSSVVNAASFEDVSTSHWANAQIQEWVDKGLVKGFGDGSFRPNGAVTRAEFMTLVNAGFGFEQEHETRFTDVKAGAWYEGAVKKAVAAGYITGFEDGTIRPNQKISRQEVAVIVAIEKENGKEVLKLTLVRTEMIPYVQQMARGETLSIGVNIAVDDIFIDVDGDTIDLLIEKGIVFQISTETGTMIWDASKVDLAKIKAQLGVTSFSQGANITFVIREQSSTSYPLLQKLSVVGQPLTMTVYYEKNDKVVSHVESKYCKVKVGHNSCY